MRNLFLWRGDSEQAGLQYCTDLCVHQNKTAAAVLFWTKENVGLHILQN